MCPAAATRRPPCAPAEGAPRPDVAAPTRRRPGPRAAARGLRAESSFPAGDLGSEAASGSLSLVGDPRPRRSGFTWSEAHPLSAEQRHVKSFEYQLEEQLWCQRFTCGTHGPTCGTDLGAELLKCSLELFAKVFCLFLGRKL